MTDSFVQLSSDQSVAHLQMDDGKANALSHEMMAQLGKALDTAEPEGSAIVISGRGGRFCAGFDLKTMMSGPQAARQLVTEGASMLMRLYEFPRPVVIACTGHAMAGGALMLLTADARLGAQGEFKIGLNEVSIGLALPMLALELARDRIDPRRLTEVTLCAKIYSPDDAEKTGFLDRVVGSAELIEQSLAEAKRLAALPADAFATSKRKLRKKTIDYIRETLEADMSSFGV